MSQPEPNVTLLLFQPKTNVYSLKWCPSINEYHRETTSICLQHQRKLKSSQFFSRINSYQKIWFVRSNHQASILVCIVSHAYVTCFHKQSFCICCKLLNCKDWASFRTFSVIYSNLNIDFSYTHRPNNMRITKGNHIIN